MRSESFFCVILRRVLLCNLCKVQIVSDIYTHTATYKQ